MKRLISHIGGLAFVASVVVMPVVANADDKDVIDYREHIMKTLDEQSGALGMVLSTAIPADNFQQHLDAIALTASIALKAFEPKVQGGESKPEVWAKWDDFSARMTKFSTAINAAAKMSREKGKESVMGSLLDALPCKDCHDIYRDQKKK